MLQIMASNSSENLFAHKSFTVPSTSRSPAVNSDSNHQATVEVKKKMGESANVQMVCVLSGRSHHGYDFSQKQGRGRQHRVRSVGSKDQRSGNRATSRNGRSWRRHRFGRNP